MKVLKIYLNNDANYYLNEIYKHKVITKYNDNDVNTISIIKEIIDWHYDNLEQNNINNELKNILNDERNLKFLNTLKYKIDLINDQNEFNLELIQSDYSIRELENFTYQRSEELEKIENYFKNKEDKNGKQSFNIN